MSFRAGCAVVALSVLTALPAAALTLASPEVADGGTLKIENVFDGFGCTGGNRSPALTWSAPPEGTQSYALTVYDPDAPTGSGWWHWVMIDIPAGVTSLPAGAVAGQGVPDGAMEMRTDFGKPGYGGPCPPPGAPHHYIFTVFALKVAKLGVPADATAALTGYMINANKLGSASFTALYGR